MYEDEISRVAFADTDMVRHLLALLPEDAVAGLDARQLRRLPAEHVGRGARRRVADMAWAVGAPTPERPDAEALLVVEFQSAPHPRMALRMEAYVALLRLEMAADLPADAGLPPTLPVLVYTGDRPWRPPSVRRLTAPAPAGLRRWQPDLEMLTLGGGWRGASARLHANQGGLARKPQASVVVVTRRAVHAGLMPVGGSSPAGRRGQHIARRSGPFNTAPNERSGLSGRPRSISRC